MSNPLKKSLNATAAGFSFLQASLTGKPVVYGMPPALGVELTNNCNLNCPECASGSGRMKRERGFMEVDLFGRIIRELGPYLLNLNLSFQGESMLHPQFFAILAKCREIHSTLPTNGHFLTRENAEKLVTSGLNRLIISLDGMEQETYSSYRVNGSIERVMEGIRNVSEARHAASSGMKIVIQFLVNRNNENQVADARKFAHDMKASLQLKSMQIINEDAHRFWLPSRPGFSRYEKDGDGYRIRSRFPNRCARLWLNPVVTWNGKVIPCCFDKDADHVLGDLYEDSFRDIWNGPRYRLFRRSLLTERAMTDICRNCTSGLK